jgi:hypothetical protein
MGDREYTDERLAKISVALREADLTDSQIDRAIDVMLLDGIISPSSDDQPRLL